MDDPPVNDDESGLRVPVDISENVGCGDGVDGKVLPVAAAACDSEAETSSPQRMLFLLQPQHAERLVRLFHGCSCLSVWMLDMSRDCRGLTDPHRLMGWVFAVRVQRFRCANLPVFKRAQKQPKRFRND